MYLKEVRSHGVGIGNVGAIEEEDARDDDHPLTSYIVALRRRIVQASIRWRRGGEDRQQVVAMRQFGQYVRSLREDLDLTRSALSERTNLDPHVLLLLEGGLVSREEASEVIDQLAKGLGQDPAELQRALEAFGERRDKT